MVWIIFLFFFKKWIISEINKPIIIGNPFTKPKILRRKIVDPIKMKNSSRSTDKHKDGKVTFSAKNNKPIKNKDVELPLNHCVIKLFNP